MESFVLLAYASLAASRTLLQRLLACLNFILESENLSFWHKRKKWFLWTTAAAQAAEKTWRWVRLDLILPMRDIYINSNLNPLTKFTCCSRSTEFKDIIPWNISKMITKTVLISTRIVISNAMTWIEYSNGGKAIEEQILASEEKNKSKRAGLWESQSEFRVGKLTIWVRSFEIEKL